MKKYKYRGIEFTLQRHPYLYGHYLVECDYRCKHIKFAINNAQAYDFCDDDERRALRRWARQWIMYKMREQYETFYL